MGWSDFVKIKKIGEGSFGAAWYRVQITLLNHKYTNLI